MANLKSALKRIRQDRKRTLRNSAIRSRAKTYVKKVNRLLAEGRVDEAAEVARLAASALDTAAAKGVIHGNNAARRKSRLMKKVNAAQSSATPSR